MMMECRRENGIEKTELTFRDLTFDYSMIPSEDGCKATSDKKGFFYQIIDQFTELSTDEDFEETIEELSCGCFEDEIFEALEKLEKWEE